MKYEVFPSSLSFFSSFSRSFRYVVLLVAALFLFSGTPLHAQTPVPETSGISSPASLPMNAEASPPTREAAKFKLKAPDEHEIFVRHIRSSAETVTFMVGKDMKAFAVEVRPDKTRAYHAGKSDGNVEAIVTSTPQGFSLSSPDGKILWNVNALPGLTNISDASDPKAAFEIKSKTPEKATVRGPMQSELGKLNYYPEKGKIKVKNTGEEEVASCHAPRFLHAPGILLMTGIPENLRYVLLAEMVAREQ
ncbi:MAG: hypothetical protein WA705_11505 [Candidatus Ozemobacteraceae bacterium]